MAKEVAKARAKEMARMMTHTMMGATGKETNRRRKMTTMITVSTTLMKMMEKTRRLVSMCEPSKKNMNRSTHTHARSKK